MARKIIGYIVIGTSIYGHKRELVAYKPRGLRERREDEAAKPMFPKKVAQKAISRAKKVDRQFNLFWTYEIIPVAAKGGA